MQKEKLEQIRDAWFKHSRIAASIKTAATRLENPLSEAELPHAHAGKLQGDRDTHIIALRHPARIRAGTYASVTKESRNPNPLIRPCAGNGCSDANIPRVRPHPDAARTPGGPNRGTEEIES